MQESILKKGKKKFYPIAAPALFNEEELGEVPLYDLKDAIGRRVKVNLMTLTNDPKRQNINIRFKVVEVEGDKGKTKIIGYEIIPSSVKRFVRRNSEKMDLSFACETADNVSLRVKPLVITKADVKGSIAAKMRNSIVQHLIKTIKKMNYNDVLNEVITHKLQASMKETFNKMYPLKVCEIRYLGIEQREKQQEAATEVKAEAAEGVKAEVVTEAAEEVKAESPVEAAEQK